ncbi:hypothetical protein G6F57_020663 [Rhizopus arrhizus]|nr:hypothetical protein G6F57_020663 [Rhizopus arrhizus]
MRVMRRGIGNAVDEPVWSQDHCGARLPGVLRAVMRNLDRTDVCPASKPKVRLHLSKGCTVDAASRRHPATRRAILSSMDAPDPVAHTFAQRRQRQLERQRSIDEIGG